MPGYSFPIRYDQECQPVEIVNRDSLLANGTDLLARFNGEIQVMQHVREVRLIPRYEINASMRTS